MTRDKLRRKMRCREGFWWSKHDRTLPRPIPMDKPWRGRRGFLKALDRLEKKLYKQCPPAPMKGSSTCRVCGCKNGACQFYWDGWTWPNGFRHYVEDHNVRPSLAFQEFVLATYLGD